MVLHRKGWLVRRRPIARSRSLWTASWRMSTICIRIVWHIQVLISITTRYRHVSAASWRTWRRITTRA